MKFADTLGGDYNSNLQRRSPGDLVRLVLLHRLAGAPQAKKETGIPAQEGCPGFRGRISSGSGSELRHGLSIIHGHLPGRHGAAAQADHHCGELKSSYISAILDNKVKLMTPLEGSVIRS